MENSSELGQWKRRMDHESQERDRVFVTIPFLEIRRSMYTKIFTKKFAIDKVRVVGSLETVKAYEGIKIHNLAICCFSQIHGNEVTHQIVCYPCFSRFSPTQGWISWWCGVIGRCPFSCTIIFVRYQKLMKESVRALCLPTPSLSPYEIGPMQNYRGISFPVLLGSS